jgi:ATP-binding cassette subfamily C protein CydCD
VPPAVAALLLLALGEPIANTAVSIQQLPQLDDVLRRVWATAGGTSHTPEPAGVAEVQTAELGLRLHAAGIGWAAGEPVVQGLDLEVNPGEWVAITGPSGSGKSTLLAAMLGALKPLSGALQAKRGEGDWTPVGAADLARVAWCPQDAHLFDSTVRSNLGLGRDAGDQPTDAELRSVLAKVGLEPWLETLPAGLDERIGSGGHRLSGGQRQRLAVARALAARARVLLLDEPTAHLGADESVALVADLRAGLVGEAVLLVTHDGAVAALADRVHDLGSASQPVPVPV